MKTAVLAMLAVGFAAAQPVDAVRGIVAAFQKHPVVIIGEAHWLERAGDFYIRLVRDPEFQETVQDIVAAFANAAQFRGAAPTLHPTPGDDNADAYLYLGPREALTMAMPPPGSLEPAYLTEIDRRSMIEWGELRARKFLGEAGK